MLQPWITRRSSALNPLKDGMADINLSLPNSIHRSLGKFAKAEKSVIGVRQAFRRSRLMRLARGDTSDIGFPSIPIPFNFINFLSGDKLVIAFCSSPSQSTLVKSARGDTSVILFPRSLMLLSRVKSLSGERSDIELCRNSIRSNLVACSSPVKSVMPLSSASIRVNRAKSVSVIASVGALLSASAIASRRFGSGMRSSEGVGLGRGGTITTGGGVGVSSELSAEITSRNCAVHTSRFTFPPLSSPVKPNRCKLDFSATSVRNASVSKPTDAAAYEASTGPWNSS